LNANSGLRYDGKVNDFRRFSGNFYLTNLDGEFIESFEIRILLPNAYPNGFPIVFAVDDKIEKTEDYHISKDGVICVEHTYVANKLASAGVRLYDFIYYYLPKYFSWVRLKQTWIYRKFAGMGTSKQRHVTDVRNFTKHFRKRNDKTIFGKVSKNCKSS